MHIAGGTGAIDGIKAERSTDPGTPSITNEGYKSPSAALNLLVNFRIESL